MNLQKIIEMWSSGIILGIKLLFLGAIIKVLFIFVIGFSAALCGSLPPAVSMSIVTILSILVIPILITQLSKLLKIENSANQQVDPIVTTPVDEVEAQGTQGHS